VQLTQLPLQKPALVQKIAAPDFLPEPLCILTELLWPWRGRLFCFFLAAFGLAFPLCTRRRSASAGPSFSNGAAFGRTGCAWARRRTWWLRLGLLWDVAWPTRLPWRWTRWAGLDSSARSFRRFGCTWSFRRNAWLGRRCTPRRRRRTSSRRLAFNVRRNRCPGRRLSFDARRNPCPGSSLRSESRLWRWLALFKGPARCARLW
jgi:hypothetical protein